MAEVLGVTSGTISRELRRYGKSTWRYSAERAQRDADTKRRQSKRPGMKIAEDPKLQRYIISELERLRSPDEIAGRMRRENLFPRVGTNAIYKWLYSDEGRPYARYLCTQRKRKRRQHRLGKRVLIPHRISLRHRPTAPGLVHSEGDLFVSPRASKACGLLVVEKSARLLTGSLIANKSAAVVVPAMQETLHSIRVDTCTLDNGIENIRHQSFGVSTFFCDPGSPQQKPQVENSIGLIRRWFLPKGTDLSTVSQETFQSQLHLLNSKYRKSLGYRSAYEAALEAGIIDRIPRVSLARAVAFR